MKEHIISYLPKGHPWADLIHYYAVTDSTNVQAKRLAEQGAPEGTICIAGHQTGGKGRMGRSFHSPENKGLYFSLILRPGCKASDLMHLTCAVAVACCNALELISDRPQIKWINDLVVQNKKLGGILTELSVDAKTGICNYAIIGIGINCLQSTDDFPEEIKDIATSIYIASKNAVSPAALAAQLVDALYDLSGNLLNGKDSIMQQYKKDCMTLNKQVRILRGDEAQNATAIDIDPDGGLIVKLCDGTFVTVSSGEVSVRGMYGYL